MPMRVISGRDPDYVMLKSLGSGSFGVVTQVQRVKDSKIMACKTIDCSDRPDIYRYAQSEIATWVSFSENTPGIADFSNDWSWNPASKRMHLYMKYYAGGDLQSLIDGCRYQESRMHPQFAMFASILIAGGVKGCHDRGIIHRDLKPSNVLLSRSFDFNDVLWAASQRLPLAVEHLRMLMEFSYQGKADLDCFTITDFGLGKFVEGSRDTRATYPIMGTPGYIPPESQGPTGTFSTKSDIYSLGVLMYVLFTGKNPPTQHTNTLSISLPSDYPQYIQDTVRQCIAVNPDMRPDINSILGNVIGAFEEFEKSSAHVNTWEYVVSQAKNLGVLQRN